PPGLQCYCLSLLAPDPGARPASAHEIANRLEALLDAGAASVPRETAPPSVEYERVRARRSEAIAPSPERRVPAGAGAGTTRAERLALALALAAPLAGALLVVLAVSGAANTGAQRSAAERSVPPQRRLGGLAAASRDCESCHPRQTAEWRRSVMAHSLK